ncbi:glycosyltransferase family 9 protein [Dysgonomonas sp. 25]|uniref:glycosyltransferase family 9 protein n=1 Tax=Dysgonomonas sp. 25 TaxID=2302933 RepID=UPI0013D12318|nr:glycosyltransferase family 9 protein [Dysgonomonas sp. 25]NDV68755.1 lipopolysaccharide heptosyltransferase family protein [Dysgonomonas sp. 25]
MPKALVIRFRRVGDAVLTSSICTTLKQSIPDCEVHYVLNENIAPLFENHPDIDRVISFSDKETHSLFRYLKKIRHIMQEGQYDIIIDARSTINTLFFPLFSLRTKYRIGLKKSYTRFIYNHRVDKHEPKMVRQLMMMTNPLNGDYKITENSLFRLYCTEKEIQAYKDYMISKGINISRPVIVCAVAARLDHKIWPLENMKEILSNILQKYKDVQLVFNFAGDKEKKIAYQLYEDLGRDPRIFINIEANSLRQLAAAFANSQFFFGNEGGPRHISQAFEIPSYAIFPPSIGVERWLPNMEERFKGIGPEIIDPGVAESEEIPFREKFNLITPQRVWTELDKMLEKYLQNRVQIQ